MQKRYDGIVYDFFEKRNGLVVLISDDVLFQKVMRSTVHKVIGSQRECLLAFESLKAPMPLFPEIHKKNIECVLFVERAIRGEASNDAIRKIKAAAPKVKVIMLISEIRRENLAYFSEIGVDSIISKPASQNNIIEKLAFTIQPQGRLSELMDKGKKLLAAGKGKETLEVADTILGLKKDSPAGLMLKGDAFLHEGERDKAIECYQRAHNSSRLYLEPLKKLAAVYKGRDEDNYLEVLKTLDRLSPLNAERKTEIGAVHVDRMELDRAEKYFDKALDTAKKESKAMVGEMADKISQVVAPVSPRMTEKYVAKLIEAKGSKLTKDDLVLFNKLGIALRSQGKWQEAIDNYRRAMQISPDDEGLQYNMGMAYYDGGQRKKAKECFEMAMTLNPQFFHGKEVVSVNIGTLYMELREYQSALPFFEEAYKANPSNGRIARKLESLRERI